MEDTLTVQQVRNALKRPHDDWLNNKTAEAEAKEQRAIAILDRTPARRLQRLHIERVETEALKPLEEASTHEFTF